MKGLAWDFRAALTRVRPALLKSHKVIEEARSLDAVLTRAKSVNSEDFYPIKLLLIHSGMSQSPRTSDTDGRPGTSIPVSTELRDKIRLEKAREGLDYDTWLRENLPIEA